MDLFGSKCGPVASISAYYNGISGAAECWVFFE
jgi:hypothetical protein